MLPFRWLLLLLQFGSGEVLPISDEWSVRSGLCDLAGEEVLMEGSEVAGEVDDAVPAGAVRVVAGQQVRTYCSEVAVQF